MLQCIFCELLFTKPCQPVRSNQLIRLPSDRPNTQPISVSLSDVITQLNALRDSSTPGPDGLPPTLLKNGGSDLPLLITLLINKSLESGYVPNQWKTSIIIPHWKSGSRFHVGNYRGIHHTCHLTRVVERIIKYRLEQHFLSNGLISTQQYGFLAKRSVMGCQYNFFSKIAAAHNEGMSIVIFYLDIKKAFDQVPHDALLHKIKASGIADPLFSWLRSYLSNRTQVTLVSGYPSPPLPITSGVVQGSVLGPTLFLLYINDVLSCIKHGTPFLFADDIKIVYTFPSGNNHSSCQHIQDDLDSLTNWSLTSKLMFAPEKCQILAYRAPFGLQSLTISNSPIPVINSTKDLGLRYTSTFNFSAQALYQVAKARQLSYLVLRSFHTNNIRIAIYKQHIRPILEYCPLVVSNLPKPHRLAIESVQRKFTKALLPFANQLNYRARCQTLKLEPLWLRRMKLNLQFFHALIFEHTHVASERPIFISKPHHNLRNVDFLTSHPLSKTKLHQYSFLPHYSRIWNSLPVYIRSIENPMAFKRQLQLYLSPEVAPSLLGSQVFIDTLYEQGPGRI